MATARAVPDKMYLESPIVLLGMNAEEKPKPEDCRWWVSDEQADFSEVFGLL